MKISPQSAGGRVRAAQQRKEAIAGYLAKPNTCAWCGGVIPIRPGEKVSTTRKKKFCNASCNAHSVNDTIRRTRPAKSRPCARCRGPVYRTQRGYNQLCPACWEDEQVRVLRMTKIEAGARTIRRHARLRLRGANLDEACKACGYTTHVEVCHIKAVKDFPDTARISEINALDNLVYLCPNHHWEFDRGLLRLPE